METLCVLVSARDNAAVPRSDVPRAVELEELAKGHGWTPRLTYALALCGQDREGGSHLVASVALRLFRAGLTERWELGFANWRSVDNGAFAFDCAFVNWERFGWTPGYVWECYVDDQGKERKRRLVGADGAFVVTRPSIRGRIVGAPR